MVDFSDWDSAEDSVYDTPRFKADKESRRKAMQKYLELSQKLEDELVAEMGQEEYDASQHWINNPLIKPRSRVHLFEQWEARIRKEENEHIVKLLEERKCGCYCEVHMVLDPAIAAIKGEK